MELDFLFLEKLQNKYVNMKQLNRKHFNLYKIGFYAWLLKKSVYGFQINKSNISDWCEDLK